MKKRGFILIALIIVLAQFVPPMASYLSGKIVNHKEAGNFINAEELEFDKVTMLHWFSENVQVYSESHKPLYFVVINPYQSITMYKNQRLLMQNESDQYPLYQSGSYMIFRIDSQDYIDNRVDLHTDAFSSTLNQAPYSSNYYVGDEDSVLKLLLVKQSTALLAIVLIVLALLLTIVVYRKLLYTVLLLLSSIVLALRIEIGVLFCVALLYFLTDKLFKRNRRMAFLGVSLLVASSFFFIQLQDLQWGFGFWQIDLYVLYVFAFLVLSIFNYLKDKTRYSLISLVANTILYLFLSIDFSFSLFRIFYEELLLTIIFVTLCLLINRNLRNHFSKEKTVKLDLLRGISHDLRVPISTIALNTELLEKDDFTTELNKTMILQIMKGATDDLVNMTNSLTAYMSEESYVSKQYRTSVHHSIERAKRYYLNNEKNIIIQTDLCDQEVYLPIDEIWINRLIFNLVDNAYKYTDPYGEIVVTLRKSGQTLMLSVEDNGIGMCKEDIDKVMEPFYRVDQSRRISGLGLGLSIVKDIVDKLEGQIIINSQLGEGTKFTIEI